VAERLPQRSGDLAGLGITGQQHGVVLVDSSLTPLSPFINWQDRRGEQIDPGSGQSYVRRAIERAGAEARQRTGCRLAAGYLAVTLFWMKETGVLPPNATACFLTDYFGALLTGQRPVTDPTCSASSGVLDIRHDDWDAELLAALELPRALFPDVRPSGDLLGGLSPTMADRCGLPVGLPIFVGIGDNQASFLGSVADRRATVLVNVGTGAQVSVHADQFQPDPLLEARPFPRGGYLLVSAGLAGGGSYAVLERFYRQVGVQLLGVAADDSLYESMNRLAAAVPRGADGLRCAPYFFGTRAEPELRASWTGVSTNNFTPAHLTRALLEGMARTMLDGYERITRHADRRWGRLVGAGNGLRRNRVLARIVAETFALPLFVPAQREEAACGAALLAAVGAGVFPDLDSACRLVHYVAGGAD
jgi:sugar (pentulose or hexulose) kinase